MGLSPKKLLRRHFSTKIKKVVYLCTITSCSYTERGLLYRKAFHTNGLMRMKLHPDTNKMIICTSSGYLMIVHDLDLETLPTDLYGFKVSGSRSLSGVLLTSVRIKVDYFFFVLAQYVPIDAN